MPRLSGGMRVNQAIERRVLLEAEYIAATGATVRKTASVLGVSKSTVHKDMETRLSDLSAPLYKEVSAVLARNKAERHLRGSKYSLPRRDGTDEYLLRAQVSPVSAIELRKRSTANVWR